LNADGLILSRKPSLDLQDRQQQPRRFSRMALHVFPLKSHPKSIFAVFSAITSQADRNTPFLPTNDALFAAQAAQGCSA
jgi:hypothetical protein